MIASFHAPLCILPSVLQVMPFLLPSWFKPGPAQSVTRQPAVEDKEINSDSTQNAWWLNGEGEEMEHLRMALISSTDGGVVVTEES